MSAKKGRSYEKKFEVAAPAGGRLEGDHRGRGAHPVVLPGGELRDRRRRQAARRLGRRRQGHADHHRLGAERPPPHRGHSGPNSPSTRRAAEPYAIDWYLEHEGGVTRVRMVASGFGEGPGWDHEYDGTFHGWDLFHKTMKHYLEHHRGQPAANVVALCHARRPAGRGLEPADEPGGLLKEGSLDDLSIGAPFRFVTSRGDVFAGVVRNYVPGKTFSAMVESLNKAMLNIEMASMPGRGHFLYLSLSTWGLPKADVDALGARIKSIVYGFFPQTTDEPASSCGATAGTRRHGLNSTG